MCRCPWSGLGILVFSWLWVVGCGWDGKLVRVEDEVYEEEEEDKEEDKDPALGGGGGGGATNVRS